MRWWLLIVLGCSPPADDPIPGEIFRPGPALGPTAPRAGVDALVCDGEGPLRWTHDGAEVSVDGGEVLPWELTPGTWACEDDHGRTEVQVRAVGGNLVVVLLDDIGIDKKEAVALVEESQVGAIVAEYPQYSARLDDFYYMPTEVTNEQFAAFVRATGSEPPRLWGKEAIDDATRAFAERVGKAAKDARDAGLPVPEFEEFDPADWWENNWQDCEWEIPTDISAHPVVYISYERAEAYARWAGLRLISEEEHQAVGRGDDDLRFPWGDEWIEEAANCTEANRRKSATADVGSYPLGASWFDPDGKRVDAEDAEKESALAVHDICGNVWEWTTDWYAPAHGDEPVLGIFLLPG